MATSYGRRDGRGRLPTDAEYLSAAPLIVVSETVAREYWPGRRAVGQSLLYKERPFIVIGVVPDARYMSLDMEPQGEIYYPAATVPQPSVDDVLVRFDAAAHTPLGPFVTDVEHLCPTCWFRSAEMLTDALSTTIQALRID